MAEMVRLPGTEWAEVVVKFHAQDGSVWMFYVPRLEAHGDGAAPLGEIHTRPVYDDEDSRWLTQYRSVLEDLLLILTMDGKAQPDAEGNRYYYIKGDPDG